MGTLIVIEGPTASGKTALSVSLAQKLNCAILSADSRQFYKEISIGTAKPTVQEQGGVRHHFIDCYSIHQEITAASYAKEAKKILELEFSKSNFVILTGGSGMFIDALCIGLDDIPADTTLRNELNSIYQTDGLATLLEELQSKDPETYAKIDRKNPARVIRAIEAIRLSGSTLSALKRNKKQELPYNIVRFVIDFPREQLYDRINLRVDNMIAAGLLQEVKSVYPYKNLGPLRTVGYKELFDYLDGICTLEYAVERIKQNSRNYAKRQITYFKRHENSLWIDGREKSEMIPIILKHLP